MRNIFYGSGWKQKVGGWIRKRRYCSSLQGGISHPSGCKDARRTEQQTLSPTGHKKLWCWRRLESPLDCKEVQPVHPKGDQSWMFIGRTDDEAETSILWPPDAKNWLIWKDPDVGKDWRQEEKGMKKVEMVGCHHLFDGHEFEQTPGVGDGQGGLACCSPWGHKEPDTT